MQSSHLHNACAYSMYSHAVRHVLMLTRLLQGVREVEEWMSQTSGIPLEELRPHMFLLRDRDATGHLMRSASPACSVWTLQAFSIRLALHFRTAWQRMGTPCLADEQRDIGTQKHWPILRQGCAGCATAVHALVS